MKPSPSAPISQYIRQEWQFAPVMGDDTAAIADFIWRSARSGRWLDLGCGPTLSIWPLFSASPTEVFGLDRNTEVRLFHEDLLSLPVNGLPSAIAEAYHAARMFRWSHGISPIDDPMLLVRDVRVHDVLQLVKSWLGQFDTVVQIGCFGCLESREQLQKAAALAYAYTASGGVHISATWLPHDHYYESETWGGSKLRSIDVNDLTDALRNAGYIIESANIAEDINEYYKARIIVEGRRP